MKKLFVLIISSILLVSCQKKVSAPVSNEPNIVIASEEQEYRAMEEADKVLKDSIGSKYNPDENGICEGAPDEYSAKNAEETKLISSLEEYYKAVMKKDFSKAKSYICPKVISLTKEKFPQCSDEDIDEIFTSTLKEFSESNEIIRTRFEGFKKAVPVVSQLYKLPSKEGCLLYSLHYSTLILCTDDDENYYAWHLPMFMYAASYDNGRNWYFIELVEDTNEVLKDFR
ncbi:MAG: hypothetical protein IKX33_02595 [Prevotella sp.]|nr:hypothetical protein [Prevotella sp.]